MLDGIELLLLRNLCKLLLVRFYWVTWWLKSSFRLQQEEELKQLEEETAKRLEEEIRSRVEEKLGSEEVRLEIERQIEEARKKLFEDVEAQLQREKEAALAEARAKEVSPWDANPILSFIHSYVVPTIIPLCCSTLKWFNLYFANLWRHLVIPFFLVIMRLWLIITRLSI